MILFYERIQALVNDLFFTMLRKFIMLRFFFENAPIYRCINIDVGRHIECS